MYQLIGKKNCSQCTLVKGILYQKGIPFEYLLIEDLPSEDQDKYLQMASEAGQRSFPLIIKENSIVSLQEVK